MSIRRYAVLMVFSLIALEIQAKPADDVWVVTKGGLMLRSGPGRKANPILLMPYGSPVKVLEDSQMSERIENHLGAWFKVAFGREVGWTFSGFLTENRPEDALFLWNPSQTMYLIVKNIAGPAEACGNAYAQRKCKIGVFKKDRAILKLNEEVSAEWRNNKEIILSKALAECAGGEKLSRAIDVSTGRETGSTSWGFINPGCGLTEEDHPLMTFTMCSGSKCAAFQTTKDVIDIYLGLPDFAKINPFEGLKHLGQQHRVGEFTAVPKFDALTFENGSEVFVIDYEHAKIVKR